MACRDDARRRVAGVALLGVLGWVGLGAGCTTERSSPAPAPKVAAPQRPLPSPGQPEAPAAQVRPVVARNWDEYRVQAALRIVKMNPGRTYLSTPPEPLLAIPVLDIELHVDGSIASIQVRRRPRQATDTIQLAIDAVRRAAPFAPVGHLPRPWRYTEVFLFDDERRFKPVALE
jgi:hypothetical protein